MKIQKMEKCQTYECIVYRGLELNYKIIPSGQEIHDRIIRMIDNGTDYDEYSYEEDYLVI